VGRRSSDGGFGTFIVRERRIVYASAGAEALLARPSRELLGRPFSEFVIEEERAIIEERHARRLDGETVPNEYETTIVLGDGGRRVVECTVALDGAEVLLQLRDVTAQAERRPRLAELARLGAELQRERSEAAVFERVREGLFALGLSSFLLGAEEDGVRVIWARLAPDLAAMFEARYGRSMVGYLGPWTPFSRSAWRDGVAFTDDWALHVSGFVPPGDAAEVRAIVAAQGLSRAVAVRLDERAAPRFYLVTVGEWLRSGDATALRLFGAQVAAAVDAGSLLEDLRRRVSELTLLNDVALASATLDPTLLLDRALRRVAETFGCEVGAAYLRDDARLLLVASQGLAPETAHAILQIGVGDGTAGRAVKLLAPVVERAAAFVDDYAPLRAAERIEVLAAFPLLSKNQALGALVVGRRDPRPFDDGDLKLLSAIGVQLGVAVENARLFADTRRRLQDLEAVHALAQRIFGNAPGDTRALLADGCAEAARALAVRTATVLLLDGDGRALRNAAGHGLPLPAEGLTLEVDANPLAEEALRTRAPVWSEDVTRDPRSRGRGRTDVPPTSVLVVPLTGRASTRGLLFLSDDAGRRFTEAERALATALAGELAMGVENAELQAQARRRVEELDLLHEVGRSLVATLELPEVLDAGVRNLARIVDAPEAYLALVRGDAPELEIRAVAGPRSELLGRRIPTSPPQDALVSLVFDRREPIVIEDAANDPRLPPDVHAPGKAYLGLPLLVRDRNIGCALIVETRGPRRFTPPELQRAAAVANQLAVAVENARLYEDLRASYAELNAAQRQLIHSERLAALGELSAIVAHEVRNPLGVIFNSLGSLRRLVHPTGDAKMLLEIVQEEADRLNRIVGDLLDFARPALPQLRPERLERVLEDAVAAAIAPASNVVVEQDVAPDLPTVPVDARMVRQAVLNVALNAVQAMPRGGRIAVRTRAVGDAVEVAIEDSGSGIPEDVRSRIFEPFFTTKATGTGLGLAVVKRIVEGHGGDVQVESRPGAGTRVTLRFPLSHPAVPATR
jgi:PAS domain S-box-containing protein